MWAHFLLSLCLNEKAEECKPCLRLDLCLTLAKVIVAIAILAGTFGLDGGTIFGTMMPGVFLTVVILNGGLWLYYRKIAAYRGDPDLTAIPAGLQAGRMFIWLYSIMLPVFLSTGNADLALSAS